MLGVDVIIRNGGNQSSLRVMNQSAIRKAIYLEAPITRSDVAKELGITLPTVTKTVNELLDLGYIKETSSSTSEDRSIREVGRPSTFLEMEEKSQYFVGMEIKAFGRTYVLTNYLGEPLVSLVNDSLMEGYEELLSDISVAIRNLLQEADIGINEVSGIGLGITGSVDSEEGLFHYGYSVEWQKKPIVEDLKLRLQEDFQEEIPPISLENNARCRATAALYFHRDKLVDKNSFAYLYISRGIVCTFINPGFDPMQKSVGEGEISHMTMNEKGPRCGCGKRGCLESYVGEGDVVAAAARCIQKGNAKVLAEIIQEQIKNQAFKDVISEDAVDTKDLEVKIELPEGVAFDYVFDHRNVQACDISFEQVLQAYYLEDPDIIEIFDNAFHYLGIAIANIFNFVRPEIFLIEGSYFERSAERNELRRITQNYLYFPAATGLEIQFIEANQLIGARSAAFTAILWELNRPI